ncbi:hypothetical protein [Psychromonas sp.]
MLKTACNVSLRTLYKHYPSKEMMCDRVSSSKIPHFSA